MVRNSFRSVAPSGGVVLDSGLKKIFAAFLDQGSGRILGYFRMDGT